MLIAHRDGMLVGKRLPYKKRVEYLESTGTQWIDTGIYVNNTLKTVIAFEIVDITRQGHIFGGRTVQSAGAGYGVFLSTSTTGIAFDYNSRLNSNILTTNFIRYEIVKDGATNTLDINGVRSFTGNNTAATFSLDTTLGIFWMHQKSGTFNSVVKCRVFHFKIWNSGVLVRDLIPVIDWNDEPCMYDRVSGKCFYNQGTGSFVAGPDLA